MHAYTRTRVRIHARTGVRAPLEVADVHTRVHAHARAHAACAPRRVRTRLEVADGATESDAVRYDIADLHRHVRVHGHVSVKMDSNMNESINVNRQEKKPEMLMHM